MESVAGTKINQQNNPLRKRKDLSIQYFLKNEYLIVLDMLNT